MRSEIANIHERMSKGGDWRTFQQEIAALHDEAATEEEYTSLLDAHQILVACAAEAFDTETYEKILPIARAEYLTFLNKEAMEDGLINPVLLDQITKREVDAGRLAHDDDFRQLAQAGGSVLGDLGRVDRPSLQTGRLALLRHGRGGNSGLYSKLGRRLSTLDPFARLANRLVFQRPRTRPDQGRNCGSACRSVVIIATLFIYGLGQQVNHSECRFLQLPSPGDLVALKVPGKIHYATVRHVEHTVASVHFTDQEPNAIVVSDWTSTYDDTPE